MIYDINLIPQTKKNASGKTNSLMVLIGLFCFIVLGVFFFYFPQMEKRGLEQKIQAKEEELAALADIEMEYAAASKQVDVLTQSKKDIEFIKSNRVKLTELADNIEKATPKDIKVTEMDMNEGMLTIKGEAPDYTTVAQFMVNMRGMEGVLSVSFMGESALDDSVITGADQDKWYTGEQPQGFTIGISYDMKKLENMDSDDTESTEEDSEGGGEE